jgi:hypothetical protein
LTRQKTKGSKVWGFALGATTPQAGFRVQGSEVQGSGFRGSRFRGSGFRVQGLEVQGLEVQGSRVIGVRCQIKKLIAHGSKLIAHR